MKRILPLLLLLVGCDTVTPVSGERTVSLSLQPRFESGRVVQAIVTPYTKSSVQHLVVKLFRVNGSSEEAVQDQDGSPVQQDLSNLDATIAFGGLHRNTTYRARAFAYKASGTDAADLISQDASSSVDILVTNDDRPAVAALPVQLIDKLFDGQATGSLEFHNGQIVDATESLSVQE